MRYSVLVILLVHLISCQQSGMKVLSEEEITNVLVDLTLSDQVIALYQPHERDSIREKLMTSLLKIHNLKKEELDSNLYIYMSDFDRFENINEKMKTKLDSLLQEQK